MNTKLYIGNLSPEVSEADLLRLFSEAGTVTEVIVPLDPLTHQSRGFGFVTMATPELAAAALKDLQRAALGGRHIVVTEAGPPQEAKGLMGEGFGFGFSVASGSARAKKSAGPRPGLRIFREGNEENEGSRMIQRVTGVRMSCDRYRG